MLEGGRRKGCVIGPTFGLGRRFFFLKYFLLAATAATATIFLVSIRGVIIVIFIWSILVTLSET
jgi:hypothetical protein